MNDRQAILSARLRAARCSGNASTSPPPSPNVEAPAPPKAYMRFADVASELGVHPRTVASWEEKGLRVCRPSPGVAIIRRVDLEAFLISRVDDKPANEHTGDQGKKNGISDN